MKAMTETQEAAATAAIASKTTYVAGTVTAVAGFTLGEVAALVGIGSTLTTLAATLFFKIRADRRAQLEHELRLAELKRPKED